MSTTVKKRQDNNPDYMWDLTHLISDEDTWQAYFKKIKETAKTLSALAGTITQDGDTLLACLKLSDQLGEDFSRLNSYTNMKFHEDTAIGSNQEATEQVSALQSTVMSAESFIEPEILTLSKEALDKMIENTPGLSHYSHYFDNLFRSQAHVLPKEQEMILAKLSDFAGSPGNIFSMFNNADLKFPDVINEKGEASPLTKGNYINYLESPDREVRKKAFETVYATYKGSQNTLAGILTSHLKKDAFYAQVRNFDSTLEASLFSKNIQTSVYHALIDSVHRHLPLLHQYMALRKKVLELDELHMYDLYVPMIQDATESISYEQAQKTVLEAVNIMGDEYVSTVNKAFDEKWIDVYENEGKRGGAYSWGTYGVHPYILLNYQDNVKNMFTLAHELGHTMHSYYSSKEQSYTYASYPIFLAEVASTVNESLLMRHLLDTTEDKKKRLYLLNHYLESFRTTLFRQTMFAEFEWLIHEQIEKGEALSASKLNEMYLELNKAYFGEGVVVDEPISLEWARIPHFYYNYYVYQYATGFSSAVAIADQLKSGGQEAVDNYITFLSSGNSRYPLDTLKAAGVDMTTSEPVDSALAVFKEILAEMSSLI